MKIRFDTEFTGLRKDTTLISIGLVADNGKMFYGIFTDYNKELCDDWIKGNVINNLYLDKELHLPHLTDVIGTKEFIKRELRCWLRSFETDIQLVSDVCHYDMMLFIDIFGTAFDLPDCVSAVCHDINQDIAQHYKVSEKMAFDTSREAIVGDAERKITYDRLFAMRTPYVTRETDKVYQQYDLIKICKQMNNKHNSLYDALVISIIDNYLNYNE